jgi:hypothetical protein
LTSDRYHVWQTSDTPDGIYDLDFGDNFAVSVAAVLGYRPKTIGVASVLTVDVYSSTDANGYPPVASSSWTSRGSITGFATATFRDFGTTFNSTSARYWRFEFNGSNPWSVGRLWLGAQTDLGGIHSPGGTYQPYRNRLETPQPGGAIVLNNLGDPGADFMHPWAGITSSLRSTLLSLQAKRSTFLMIDADSRFFEVFLVGGRVNDSRRDPSLFDDDVSFKAMP